MTRTSKEGKRRAVSPRRRSLPSVKTGSKKDALEAGYKEHFNAAGTETQSVFIPRIK
jgi:hypothetical protein